MLWALVRWCFYMIPNSDVSLVYLRENAKKIFGIPAKKLPKIATCTLKEVRV